jgi:hypothetical protein
VPPSPLAPIHFLRAGKAPEKFVSSLLKPYSGSNHPGHDLLNKIFSENSLNIYQQEHFSYLCTAKIKPAHYENTGLRKQNPGYHHKNCPRPRR